MIDEQFEFRVSSQERGRKIEKKVMGRCMGLTFGGKGILKEKLPIQNCELPAAVF